MGEEDIRLILQLPDFELLLNEEIQYRFFQMEHTLADEMYILHLQEEVRLFLTMMDPHEK